MKLKIKLGGKKNQSNTTWFTEKINKIDKSPARLTMEKTKAEIINIRNEIGTHCYRPRKFKDDNGTLQTTLHKLHNVAKWTNS